jgi:hypothetical protein
MIIGNSAGLIQTYVEAAPVALRKLSNEDYDWIWIF